MEACASAHYWAREIQALGHEVRLIPPQYVRPFVKTNKNDAADAEAICEAVTRPTMRFAPAKSAEQQSVSLIETPTRQHAMLPMAAAGADEAARPAQPDQRRAALLLRTEGLPKRLVAQTTHARCNLEPHNRDPIIQHILRTYIPTGGVSRISRIGFDAAPGP